MDQQVPLAAFQAAVLSHKAEAARDQVSFESTELSEYSKVLEAGFPAAAPAAVAQQQSVVHQAEDTAGASLPSQGIDENQRLNNSLLSGQVAHPFMPPAPPGTGSMAAPTTMSPTLQNLLMSWYWCGYYAGQHEAAQSGSAAAEHS